MVDWACRDATLQWAADALVYAAAATRAAATQVNLVIGFSAADFRVGLLNRYAIGKLHVTDEFLKIYLGVRK